MGNMSKRPYDDTASDRREFPNPYPPYSQDGAAGVLQGGQLTDAFCSSIRKTVDHLIKQMELGLRSDCDESDFSIYTGVTGISLLYLHLYQVLNQQEFLAKSYEYVKRPLRHLKERRYTFMCGDAGPLAVGAVIYNKMGKQSECQDCIKKLQRLYKSVLDPGLPDEILYGRAGYLFALLFVQKHLGESSIDADIIDKVCQCILDSGQHLSRQERSPSPLMYEWHGKKYIGAAHGITGILALLMQISTPSVSKHLNTLIKPTVDYILSLKFPSGNYPSSLGNQSDRLIHWCHGAPGVIHMLLQAHKVFQEDKYLSAAVHCGEVIWKRGILRKGYGLCHGTAGNGYAFIALYQATKNVQYLYNACKFAEWCTDYGKHGCRIADRPYSLMEGMAGTVFFLSDLLSPESATFPAMYT